MYIMIFTRRTINKKPIAPLIKNPLTMKPNLMPVKFGNNMFDAVAKFSNCESCDKMK